MYTYQANLHRVIDGDTAVLNVDLGFNIWTRETFRFLGIDADPLNTMLGQVAWIRVQKLLSEAVQIVVNVDGLDRYGRWLAKIYFTDEASANPLLYTQPPWQEIGEVLIREGEAREWNPTP